MAGPLSHIRVLDLSRILAGPWAGQILADLGADVVKVERPGAGDDTRGWGPPFLKDKDGRDTREAGYYLAVNRGKRSIALDLADAEGQRIVRALAAKADIVLENFKAGALKKYGLDYDGLSAVNPRLIYCSITGFGQDGPRRDQAAYDFMIQGMCGLMSVTGEADGKPGGGPQKVGVPIVDIMTGMYARDRRAGRARAPRRERAGRIHRHRHARRRRVVPRQPGDELSRLRQAAAAQRQRASEHPAAGRVPRARRLPRARGRQRRAVRAVLRRARASRTWRRTSASGPTRGACATTRC